MKPLHILKNQKMWMKNQRISLGLGWLDYLPRFIWFEMDR